MILQNGIEHLRDPFILVENGVYYAYGTGIDTGSWASSVWALYINKSGRLDGGHGMIFKAFDGTLYLSVHSPNAPVFCKQPEKVIFVPVKEQNGTLVCEA